MNIPIPAFKNHNRTRGFILPTSILLSTAIAIIGVVILQYITSASSSMNTQYYDRLATEAMQSGVVYVNSCVKDGSTSWTTPITPATECSGATAGPSRTEYVGEGTEWKSTFSVSTLDTSGSYNTAVVTGTVNIYVPGSTDIARTITKKSKIALAKSTTIPIARGQAVTDIASGGGYSCAVANTKAYCWGFNTAGSIGLGDSANKVVPTLVNATSGGGEMFNKRVDSVTAGVVNPCAVAEGRAYCWGINTRGQLGNGTNPGFFATFNISQILLLTRHTPKKVTGPLANVNITKATASWGDENSTDVNFICALTDGKVFCWGSNSFAQLAQPDYQLSANPFCSSSGWTFWDPFPINRSMCPKPQSTGINPFDNHDEYSPVPVLGYGSRQYENVSQLFGKRVTDIDAGHSGPCAITNGKVYCWGSTLVNAALLSGHIGAINSRNTEALQTGALSSLSATSIAAGKTSNCAIADGKSYCWGQYSGDGTGTIRPDPILSTGVPTSPSLTGAVVSNETAGPLCVAGNGDAYCWGVRPGIATPNPNPTLSSVPGHAITKVSTGAGANIVDGLFSALIGYPGFGCMLANATPYCMGNNSFGQLGNGTSGGTMTTTYAPVGTASDAPDAKVGLSSGAAATQISSGGEHNCAIVDGYTYCWGDNSKGQLGAGDTTDRDRPTGVTGISNTKGATKVSAGDLHTCNIVNGQAYCWGDSANGKLGSAGGDSVMARPVTGLTGAVTDISAGKDHTCAVMNSRAYCWGNNTDGKLGNGGTGNSTTPVAVAGLLNGKAVTKIAVGDRFSCAIADALPYCWGNDSLGQLGNSAVNTSSNNPVQVGVSGTSASTDITAGDSFACIIESGIPKCWGNNALYRLGDNTLTTRQTPVVPTGMGVVSDPRNTTSISAGSAHVCAVANSRAYCWGDIANGKVGNPASNGRTPVQISESSPSVIGSGSDPQYAYQISAGKSGSCAIANGKIACWGAGDQGQIGMLADNATRTQPTGWTSPYARENSVSIIGVDPIIY